MASDDIRNDPVKFIETYLDIELQPYHKEFIYKLEASRTKGITICYKPMRMRSLVIEAYEAYVKELLNA